MAPTASKKTMNTGKFLLLMASMVMVMSSCSKLESNEKKYLDAMSSDDFEVSAQGFTDFCEWLKKDKSTMTYDFNLMREKLGMNVLTSADGKLRTYSWITNGDQTAPVYANVVQWLDGESFLGYSGPLNNMLNSHKKDAAKNKEMAHSIDTIMDVNMDKQHLYLVVQSYLNADGRKRSFVSALTIQKLILFRLPFFFDGTEVAGNNEYEGNIKVGDLFKWDEKNKLFYAYQTDDNFHVIPNQYTVFKLGNDKLNRVVNEADQTVMNNN